MLDIQCPSVYVRVDALRLHQCITNLMSNAMKYTPKGGTVVVTLRRDQNEAVLSVHDSGIGIRADELPRIFDRLYHLAGCTQATQTGYGLGLFIAKSLAELHGGTLIADSPGEGQGATFTLRLSMAPA